MTLAGRTRVMPLKISPPRAWTWWPWLLTTPWLETTAEIGATRRGMDEVEIKVKA